MKTGQSIQTQCWREEAVTHVFEVLKEVGNGLALAVSEDGLIQAIARFSCNGGFIRRVNSESMEFRVVPPQHEELQMPISTVGTERSRRQSPECPAVARASKAPGWSQIGADVDLVDAMKIALVLKKGTTSNKGQMHLVGGG